MTDNNSTQVGPTVYARVVAAALARRHAHFQRGSDSDHRPLIYTVPEPVEVFDPGYNYSTYTYDDPRCRISQDIRCACGVSVLVSLDFINEDFGDLLRELVSVAG